jgi:hypothetical protein
MDTSILYYLLIYRIWVARCCCQVSCNEYSNDNYNKLSLFPNDIGAGDGDVKVT